MAEANRVREIAECCGCMFNNESYRDSTYITHVVNIDSKRDREKKWKLGSVCDYDRVLENVVRCVSVVMLQRAQMDDGLWR